MGKALDILHKILEKEELVIGSILGTFLLAAGSGMLSDEGLGKNSTTDALKANDFTPIEVGGYSWFGCSSRKYEMLRTKFTAVASNGKTYTGVFCKGPFTEGINNLKLVKTK